METNRVTPITHDLNVRPDILPMLMNGSKTVEVRTAKDRFTRINLNDTLKFNGRRDAVFNVLRIGEYESFEDFLKKSNTTSFLVIKDDTLLYEWYGNGYDEESLMTSFSVAKSFSAFVFVI